MHADTLVSPIIDGFGRTHNYLRISLTERCNLRCFYCMPENGIPLRDKSHFMTREEIFKMAQIFTSLGVNKIRLTGGEPLVRKCAHEIIQDLGTLNTQLAITTNGILAHQFIDSFKSAGIQSVNFSLDSLNPVKQTQISRRDYGDRVLQNIYLLLDQGFKIKVNVVLIKGVNDDEIIPFIELTRNKNLHIRFIEFMPFNGNDWNWKKGVGLMEVLEKTALYYGKTTIKPIEPKAHDTSKVYQINNHVGTFGVISSVTNPFCDTCNRIRLTADGKLKNCLFSNSETDLLGPLRKGQDIIPLIRQNIMDKKKVRAGMDSINDFSKKSTSDKNRSMIAIGG